MTTTKNNEDKKLNLLSEREQSQACLNSAEYEKNQGRKVLNVPNLRFKEFQGEWEKCKLGDYGKVVTGNTPPTKDIENYENGTYLWASPADLGTIKSITETKTMLSAQGFSKTRTLPKGSVLVTCIGSTIGKAGMATKEMSTNQQINSIVVNDNNDNEFVYYAIQSAFPRYLSSIAVQAVPIISKSAFELLPNNRPYLQEQKKIGKFLSLLDERIATQSKIIDKLQSLIKGIADKLFQTARTTKPLLEFAPNITSGTDKSGSGTIPLYGSTGIIGTVKNASQKGNIVLVARVGTIGTVQYVNEPCGVSDNALIVEAGEMTKYIYHFLKTYNFTRITSGTTQPLITASSLKKAAIPTYDIESQTRIVLCLNGLEKKLDMAKQYLSDIAVMKQYLLRQMFI